MLFDNFSVLYSTLHVVLITLGTLGMVCTTTEFKYSTKKTAIIFSLYILYTFVSADVTIYFFGYLILIRVFLLTVTLPAILLIYFLAKDHPIRAVFNQASQVLFALYISVTIVRINAALWNSALADLVLIILIFPSVILLEYRFLRRPFLALAANIKRGWGVLALLPSSLLVLSVLMVLYPAHFSQSLPGTLMLYTLGAVAVIIYFVVFKSLATQSRFQLASRNTELLELQVNNLTEKLAENETAAENARIERHDTRHKLQILSSLVANGDTKEALDYIHASLSQLHEPTQTRYCNNPILNTILSTYVSQAENLHIQLETRFSFPEDLPVDAMELSIVFANALENAIQACLKLPEKKRRIVCKCIHTPTFMMEISNPYEGTILFSKDKLPLASKKGHGFGTRSIAAFCKKHDAFCVFDAKNDWFTVKIIL